MSDYILALGANAPYGFSARDDAAAARHAAEYLVENHRREWEADGSLPVTLAGPNGMLTAPDEGLRAFCLRINPPLTASSRDDIEPGDPMIPDCNHG